MVTIALHALSPAALVASPDTDTLRRDVQRQKRLSYPAEPANIMAINLVHPWTSTGGPNPRPFLIHDSGIAAGHNRIRVFAADEPLHHLAGSDTWYMDGNFKSVPKST